MNTHQLGSDPRPERCRLIAPRRPSRHRVPSAALAVLVVSALVPAAASAVTPPASDPFYTPPANLAQYPHGTILRERQVTLSGPTADSRPRTPTSCMYPTTNATGQPVAAVTTVMVPTSPALGPRRLASYQTYYDSLTLNCAPSYTLQGGNNGGGTNGPTEQTMMSQLLQQGWDVVTSDYEGLESEWAVGPMLGYATVDSIIAAEHFAPAGLQGREDRGHAQRLLRRLGGVDVGGRAGAEIRAEPRHRRRRRRWELPRPRLHDPVPRQLDLVRDRNRGPGQLQPRIAAGLQPEPAAQRLRAGPGREGRAGRQRLRRLHAERAVFGTRRSTRTSPIPKALAAYAPVKSGLDQISLKYGPLPKAPLFLYNSVRRRPRVHPTGRRVGRELLPARRDRRLRPRPDRRRSPQRDRAVLDGHPDLSEERVRRGPAAGQLLDLGRRALLHSTNPWEIRAQTPLRAVTSPAATASESRW